LLTARFLLGLAEGPMVPVSQTVMAETSAPERRGVAMGFMQMVGAFGIAGVLGPVVATRLADGYGWRHTLLLSVVPGLVLALLLWIVLHRDQPRPASTGEQRPGLVAAMVQLVTIRNMRVSLIIAGMMTAWLVLQNTFLAVFLTQAKGLDPATAGSVIAMGGIAGITGGIGLPFLSDRIGRKRVLIGGSLAGIACPIALLLLPGDPVLLGAAVLLGWLPIGVAPLYCATVPTESVPAALATSAVGLSMGFAEFFGGVIVPPIAGSVADQFGLQSVFYICIALATGAALVALLLKETAPRIVGARGA
jgi:predicted MFS family arabinose efflux permease